MSFPASSLVFRSRAAVVSSMLVNLVNSGSSLLHAVPGEHSFLAFAGLFGMSVSLVGEAESSFVLSDTIVSGQCGRIDSNSCECSSAVISGLRWALPGCIEIASEHPLPHGDARISS